MSDLLKILDWSFHRKILNCSNVEFEWHGGCSNRCSNCSINLSESRMYLLELEQ